jgi:uncharacterized low-complexity protein
MKQFYLSRRSIIKTFASATLMAPLIHQAVAEDVALLSEEDTAAKAMHYVSDASRAKGAKPGSKCANCSLYAGDSKATQALCGLFGNKQVLANGWCEAWTDL